MTSECQKDSQSRQLCRLCLGHEQELLDIFDVQHAHTDSLTDRINEFLQLKILQCDNLPKWICKQCLDKIDDFTSFREQCKLNERKLLLDLRAGVAECLPEGNHPEDVESSDDEETEMIVIDPFQDYESSNQSLPQHDETAYGGENGTSLLSTGAALNEQERLASDAEGDEEDLNGSLAEEEEEDDDEEDNKCDTFPKDATNGLPHGGGSTNSTPQKTVVYTCKYCDVAFADSSACQLHEMQDHDLLAPFACQYCAYKTAIRLSLISHIREMHQNPRPYICVICNKGFPRRSDLKKHTFVHTGVRPFACDQCGKSFSRNTNLTKHMRIHSGLKPHGCELCPRSFANRADLVRHQKTHSGHGSQFSCARCGNIYARKDKLYSHQQLCFSQMLAGHDAPTVDGLLSAGGSMLQSNNSDFPMAPFSLHFGSQIPFEQMLMENPVPSELLSDPVMANFPSISQPPTLPPAPPPPPPLITSPSPPSSKIFNCTECPKRFLSETSLRVHQTTHSAEDTGRAYECPHCQSQFLNKREFERHLMTHADVKPFGCTSCNKKFSRKDKLHRHERVHQRERQSFECPTCAAKFQRKGALASHLKIHCTGAFVPGGFFTPSTPVATTTAAAPFPFNVVREQQQQFGQLPPEHSMLYMFGNDVAAPDSSRM
ncbi:zinc finger protein 467-like [Anopheles ziemanni]|uniref:zinc finger protein 467-like n=1 Tax=Anopheles coustani TaxID=139045 RepID=UPI0026598039|nr:zinc finger protein 467-like [Anopheles coustani]XP_058177874.1 zinc finger protein 467-like [Anopheles ziemanni]